MQAFRAIMPIANFAITYHEGILTGSQYSQVYPDQMLSRLPYNGQIMSFHISIL